MDKKLHTVGVLHMTFVSSQVQAILGVYSCASIIRVA